MDQTRENIVEAGIIIIGNEVLSGETLDTNSQYIGKKLNELGILVRRKISIPDRHEDIIDAINQLSACCRVLIVSGGLGPTNDDITKKTLATYYQSELVFDKEVFREIERLLKHRVSVISEVHRNQAYIPACAKVLSNNLGTASGLLFEENGHILIALPGVPYELRGLMDNKVYPFLKNLSDSIKLVNLNIKTIGLGESVIAQKIKDIEDSLPAYIKLAYLPSIGQVKLRLTAQNGKESLILAEMEEIQNRIVSRIENYIYGFGDITFSEALGELLRSRGSNLSIAESCTGGFVAHTITSVSGSSQYFNGGVIAYSNEIKVSELQVEESIIKTFGAVSKECAEAMAIGVRNKFNTNYAIATTGIAGPDGGTEDKPVGTVWLAVASENSVISKMIVFDRGRLQNIQFSTMTVLNMLRKLILQLN
ncbi:MAG: competence/damage-inducible protein A [Bacteroidetes bacterium]|jgi:nicotinamide-nucleotide amidase|nr:competence/damage-inducible protein A [Bacteroidota bacterium]MBT5527600.1 competence/damage-inducible protein A [Cytophagia bacterium]MBT3802118.1 competence/damage-inducible protein A [Bacteroidota bacterium]MBT3934506.1 competence/damage-inducible protein A [Bacteroidota bacterium]MBT4338670.1 competence/damage-inducible protein A [Bacteroidota bacterium]